VVELKILLINRHAKNNQKKSNTHHNKVNFEFYFHNSGFLVEIFSLKSGWLMSMAAIVIL